MTTVTPQLKSMSGTSRLWVYQANRFLTKEEIDVFQEDLEIFLSNWTSHGTRMMAAAEVLHQCVVVIALDESQGGASGCGIDKSVQFMQKWGANHSVDLLSRQTVVYQKDDQVMQTTIQQFWAMRKAGLISDETAVIDPTIQKLEQWPESGWVSFKNSWHQMMWGR